MPQQYLAAVTRGVIEIVSAAVFLPACVAGHTGAGPGGGAETLPVLAFTSGYGSLMSDFV